MLKCHLLSFSQLLQLNWLVPAATSPPEPTDMQNALDYWAGQSALHTLEKLICISCKQFFEAGPQLLRGALLRWQATVLTGFSPWGDLYNVVILL